MCGLAWLSGAVLLHNNTACRPNLELPVRLQPAWMLDSSVPHECSHPGAVSNESSTATHCAHCRIFMATELLHNHLASLPDLDILIGPQPAWMLASAALKPLPPNPSQRQKRSDELAQRRLSDARDPAKPFFRRTSFIGTMRADGTLTAAWPCQLRLHRLQPPGSQFGMGVVQRASQAN